MMGLGFAQSCTLGLNGGRKSLSVSNGAPATVPWLHKTSSRPSSTRYHRPVGVQRRARQPFQWHMSASDDKWNERTNDPFGEGEGDQTPEKNDDMVSGDGSNVVVPDTLSEDILRAISGKGKDDCEQCGGEGTIACPVCDGTGFVSMTIMDTVSAAQCRLCRGRRAIPCPSCRDFIFKSVIWWDQIPSEDEDPDENWRQGPDGMPRIPWSPPPQ